MTTNSTTRVLVTGASGFLGHNVMAALARRTDIEPIAACRDLSKLAPTWQRNARCGDLTDERYRAEVVRDVDVVCHTGTWSSLWNHRALEYERFLVPARDLMEQSIRHGVRRFIFTNTVVIGAASHDNRAHDDFATARRTGFWPHLDYLIEFDEAMRANCQRGTQMVNMRLGHFVGRRNRLGIVPALTPRLRTYLVPWLAGGRRRLPLVADSDLGEAFALAASAAGLDDYESFNICGAEFPSLREVVEYIAHETGFPKPLYSVPFAAGYAFAWLMEKLHPLLPGHPFLTRSIVHLCEGWVCPTDYARRKLGFQPKKDWRLAVREQLAELRAAGFPWSPLAQAS